MSQERVQRRVFILLEGTNAVSSAKVHGGGVFARWIAKEIGKEARKENIQVILLCPKGMIAQTIEEKSLLDASNALIVEYTSILEVDFERGDILFIPIMESAHVNYKDLKKKNPELIIRVVIHGIRNRDLLHYEKYQKYYHEWYRACPGMGLLSFIRQLRASLRECKEVRRACRYADMVFTDSNSSMERIVRLGKPRKIKYYHPSSIIPAQGNRNIDNTVKYTLLINANRPEKNFLRTLVAFCEYKKQNCDDPLQLYAVGVTDHIREVIRDIREIDSDIMREYVKMFGYITSEELASLFKGSYFLLYPSRSEGYGLPLLDAMEYGRPVVASRITSVPEVLGSAAFYVDPYSTQSILEGIAYMSDEKNNQRYQELIRKVTPMVHLRQEIDRKILITEILD